ncbi:MAG: GNAT family protein [Erythrobacter sp.]
MSEPETGNVGREVTPLQTDRFTMRSLKPADCAALFPTLSDADQCRYLTRAEFICEEELWGWLAEPQWPGRTWIAVDECGVVAGRFVAIPAHEDGVEEVGYITCMDQQGQGVASECTKALIAHLFAQGTRKITAEVDAENHASVRLLESLGFTREAHFREHETTHIGLRDVYWYGLLKSGA